MTRARPLSRWRVVLCLIGWHKYEPAARDAETLRCVYCGALRHAPWQELP